MIDKMIKDDKSVEKFRQKTPTNPIFVSLPSAPPKPVSKLSRKEAEKKVINREELGPK